MLEDSEMYKVLKPVVHKIAIGLAVLVGMGVLYVYATPTPIDISFGPSRSEEACNDLSLLYYQAQGIINSNVDLPFEFWEQYAKILNLMDAKNCHFEI